MARSNAHERMWLTCSFMVRESGTNWRIAEYRCLLPMGSLPSRAGDQCGDDGLFELGAGPALGAIGDRAQVQAGGIEAALCEVDFQNVQPLIAVGQVDEKNLIEAALADHLGGQKIDAVGGGDDEQARRFFLHEREEETKNSVEHAVVILVFAGDAGLDFIEPGDGGGDLLHGAAGGSEEAFGVADAVGKNLHHVDAIEGQIKGAGDGAGGEAFPAAGDAHEEQPLGDDFRGQAVAQHEQPAALREPVFRTSSPPI